MYVMANKTKQMSDHYCKGEKCPICEHRRLRCPECGETLEDCGCP